MGDGGGKKELGASDVTRRMLCGGLAGMVAKTATNPLERIKMLKQTGEHGAAAANHVVTATAATAGAQHGGHHHPGIVAIYRNILQTEGIIGLWAGNGANLMRVFPSKAVVFASNDVYRKWLTTTSATMMDPTSASFLAGGMAGMTATATTYPLDLARGRISGKVAIDKAYTSVYHTIRLTVRDEGIRGLYKGMAPTILGAMPYVGIQFGTVGWLERQFPQTDDAAAIMPSPWRKTLFGGLGGVMAGLVTYPNDTVRRLLQLQGSRGTVTVYKGYIDCVRQTIAVHGVRRLYRGLGINLIRMAPNSAVQFGSYEFFKTLTA
jgi:hypothetical protein